MKEAVRAHALSLGFDSAGFSTVTPPVGFAHYERWLANDHHAGMGYLVRHKKLRADPKSLLPEAKTVVAVTLNYNQELNVRPGFPKIARYAQGRDYHKVLRQRLRRLAQFIDQIAPGSVSRACVDSAPIFEREYANRAGLGWFGKNTMLIDTRRGSWFFIGLLLTSAEFDPDNPAEGGCGTCTKCIDACPTTAIVNKDGRWQVDSRRCISYLTIEHKGAFDQDQSKMVGDWTFGCDVCQEVCPFNAPRPHQPERAAPTATLDFMPREWPTLTRLTQISYDDWDDLTRGSAVRRAGHHGLARNAKACLELAEAP